MDSRIADAILVQQEVKVPSLIIGDCELMLPHCALGLRAKETVAQH